jgi:hypothetical protein
MVDQFTCPHCSEQVENRNSLCDNCWSEYLGTHIGGRVDEECDCLCPICLSIQMRYKTIQEEKIK